MKINTEIGNLIKNVSFIANKMVMLRLTEFLFLTQVARDELQLKLRMYINHEQYLGMVEPGF